MRTELANTEGAYTVSGLAAELSGKVRRQLGERRCHVRSLVLSHCAEWQGVGSTCNSAPRYRENCVCVLPNVRDHPLPRLLLQSLLVIAATLLFPES